MLDVKKELEAYLPVVDTDPVTASEDASEVWKDLDKALNRIGKEQYKASRNIEEILELFDKQQESLNEAIVMKQPETKIELTAFPEVIIELVDMFEDIYHAAESSMNEAWRMQMDLIRRRTADILKKCNMERMEPLGRIFSGELHIAKDVKMYPGVQNGQILDTIRNGYLYEGKVIRKAEIVVNRSKHVHEGGKGNE